METYSIETLERMYKEAMNTKMMLKEMNADWQTIEELEDKALEIKNILDSKKPTQHETTTDSMFS